MPHGSFDIEALKTSKIRKKIYFHLFEKHLLKAAKFVHIIGESESVAIDKLASNIKKVLIPNGQPVATESNNQKFNDDSRITPPDFGYCGRIIQQKKGIDLLLEGFQIYKDFMGGRGKLWFVGDGKDFDSMKQLAEDIGGTKNVRFFGAKYGLEKEELLKQFDAFYHTSRYEGMPMAILEAAALGIPCVVSEGTNMKDYISSFDAGIGLEENTPLCIANSMIEIEEKKMCG